MQVGRAMASTADYEQALAALIRTISELLNVESAGFHAVRPGTFGAGAPAARVRVRRPGADRRLPPCRCERGGNAVKVFLSGRPYLTNDAAGDPRLIRRFVDLFDARHEPDGPR